MNAVSAIWTNGRILPSEPVDWPDGSELLVEPLSTESKNNESILRCGFLVLLTAVARPPVACDGRNSVSA